MQEIFDFEQGQPADRVFLGWDTPLLQSVSRWLLAESNRSELATTLVIVPTSNSGRRLRMELARGGGVLAPRMMSPSGLFEVDGVASRQQSLWAWTRVIQRADRTRFPKLLGNHANDVPLGFGVALALARQFLELREDLANADASFRDAGYHSQERERWAELDTLESEVLQQFKKWKLRDSVLAKRQRAECPELSPEITRVVMAGVADPTLLAVKALQSLISKGVPVSILIQAPLECQDRFDSWGIPLPEAWSGSSIEIPHWQDRLHVANSSADAAKMCIKAVAEHNSSPHQVALALCDASLEMSLDKVFGSAGWPLYHPEGSRLADCGVVSLLRVMRDLVGFTGSFEAMLELTRLPGAEIFLPENTDRHEAAVLMDKLRMKHLPESLEDAIHLASGKQRMIVDSVARRLKELEQNKLGRTLGSWIGQWLGRVEPAAAEALEVCLAEALDAVNKLECRGDGPTAVEAFEMLLESVHDARTSHDRGGTVLDLEGWLEVAYDPAPHLILAGMHEESVPGGSVDDLFLPDSMRSKLGLRSMGERFARDAFLLRSALEVRKEEGRVDAVITRFNDAGEARKPSRLLMRQSGKQLAQVVCHLFSEPYSGDSPDGAWQRDWQLKVAKVDNPFQGDKPNHLSPSAIKDYLDCPFRFYLKRVVGMQTHDFQKHEMDALDFGNLCHKVLEQFGADQAMLDEVDPSVIENYLMDGLDTEMARLYGVRLSLPLTIQLESARERLRAFALLHAADRSAGWRIVATELAVGEEALHWQLGAHPIKMSIDRIDRHEQSGIWRVWDYKTSGKANKPADMHCKTWVESENRPQLGDLIAARRNQRKPRRWADVQLPMYAAFVRQHFETDDLPQVGYINLPRAVSDVSFSLWSDFDETTLDQAMSWAEEAIRAIRRGDFQQATIYSSSEREWDEFGNLAPDGLAAAFELLSS